MKNKHGRVGVKRQRPTRAELKKNMYQHGYRAGAESREVLIAKAQQAIQNEREFTKSLLKLSNAARIHEAIKVRHAS